MKNILITGCSSGIGNCAAFKLREDGYHVFATARKMEDVVSLKAQGFDAFQLDLTDIQSIPNTVNEILEKSAGSLYGLINNAGYLQVGAIEDLEHQHILDQFETNLFGAMHLIKLILPVMKRQGHGRIIQISSFLGLFPIPFFGAYVASKFALEGFSRVLSQELSGTNIFVSIINPGSTRTKFRENGFKVFKNTIDQQNSDYQKTYLAIEDSYFKPNQKVKLMVNPDVVVKQIKRALESRRPSLRYYPGIFTKLVIFSKNILPENLFDKIIAIFAFKRK